MSAESGEKQKYNDNEYSCKNCVKSFPFKSQLIVHERVHTGLKPYKCDICKKTFLTKSNLNVHKRIHTGLKPYECEICEKTFSQSANLAIHKRIHTGEKSYSCEICQKSYSQKSNLLKHQESAVHLNRKERMNKVLSHNLNNYVDCGEAIKVEDIKEEINEEESVDDPLSIEGNKTKAESKNIVTEMKEEEFDGDSLCVEEIHHSGDRKNNIVVDDIDIVEHKIAIDF